MSEIWTSEIQTFCVLFSDTKGVWNLDKIVNIDSDSKAYEIWIILPRFLTHAEQKSLKSVLFGNRRIIECLKSTLVWISDTLCNKLFLVALRGFGRCETMWHLGSKLVLVLWPSINTGWPLFWMQKPIKKICLHPNKKKGSTIVHRENLLIS